MGDSGVLSFHYVKNSWTEIQLRGFSIHTQDSYLRCVTGLARFYHRNGPQNSDSELS